jgi:hypothetical protein
MYIDDSDKVQGDDNAVLTRYKVMTMQYLQGTRWWQCSTYKVQGDDNAELTRYKVMTMQYSLSSPCTL